PLFSACARDHRDLHSFPTRRSSDLNRRASRVVRHGNVVPGAVGSCLREAASLVIVVSVVRADFGCRLLGPARLPWRSEQDLKGGDRKSTRLNSSHVKISYAVFCLKK